MRIRVVDAFADRPFTGNPAGVCVLPAGAWPEAAWMQSVAAELQHAETAFVKPSPGGDAEWELRWFTPTIEVDLCGHATLATTHALLSDGLVSGKVGFSTRSGVLTASVDDGWITLDFPVNRTVEAEAPAGLIAALGAEPVSVHSTGALTDVFVVLPDESALRALAPDLGQVKAINQRERNRGTIVTAPANSGFDFVSRFFAPAAGIPEDPVCGSAHTALAPYWAERLGRNELVGFQASARGGVVRVATVGDRVHLSGQAITTLDGDLLV
ncbi:PhzF family phenazine biosynthesis protein [Kribbella sp. NBC_01510]|uniref:PhzF family phenazine biosynthesis protein n=1 Tax=Kribbella sp. NBC_01510 TaxID=2903581 RepID=UPI003866CC26